MPKNTQFFLLAGGLVLVIGFLIARRTRFTEGTRFENTGVFGALGLAADTASGGVLSDIGEAIGGGLADIREGFLGDPLAQSETTIEDIREQLGVFVG